MINRYQILARCVAIATFLPLGANARTAYGQARLDYRQDSACGGSKQMTYLVNTAARPLKVTVRITSRVAPSPAQTQDQVIPVSPNESRAIGCVDEGAVPPYIHHTYQIINIASSS
jgi:hypothetical protein